MSTSVAIWTPQNGVRTVRGGAPTRCASVLKPAYAWVCDHPEWDALAKLSITRSDNEATGKLTGQDVDHLAMALSERASVEIEPAETWGRLLVTATDIASIYAALVTEEGDKSSSVVRCMNAVVPAQRFGFKDPVKAGWDLYGTDDGKHHMVTNIVVITPQGLVAVATDRVVSYQIVQRWQMALIDGPEAVIPFHVNHRGQSVRELVGLGLSKIILP